MDCYNIKRFSQYAREDYTIDSMNQQNSRQKKEKSKEGDHGQQLKESKEKDHSTIHLEENLQYQISQMFYKSICILDVFYRVYTCHVSIFVAIESMGMKESDDRGEPNDVVESFYETKCLYSL